MKLFRLLYLTIMAVCAVSTANAQTWTAVQNVPNIKAGAMALLTDGRVLVHEEGGSVENFRNWWTLSPDTNGHYETGVWKRVASLPPIYGPLYFGSAVLPDGRYIIEGGEDNFEVLTRTTIGAIYDPVADHWTAVNPPSGWRTIGDSPSVVLADGTYMQTSCCDRPPKAALLDASTLTWTPTGESKFDVYDEEGLTLLPNGSVLDVDAYVGVVYDPNGKNWETFDPITGNWTSQGSTPEQYWDSAASCGGATHASHELGPAVLIPNGTVLQTGANRCAAGHNGIYTVASNSWAEAPDFPDNLDIADGPAALERNGNVLLMTSPGIFQTGAVFLEWNGSSFNQVPGPPNGPNDSSYFGHFLMLPTGQIMFTDRSGDVELFNSAGSNYSGWNPEVRIRNIVFALGHTYTLNGFKFNGASQNNAYGDDFQDATNYPLVRLTNVSSGHVIYARTHDHSTMAVGYTGPTSTRVDIPLKMETGLTNMQVVVNGIASQNYTIIIR